MVDQSCLASKRRADQAIQDARHKSFGIREEHRITWALFEDLYARVRQQHGEGGERYLDGPPSYVWAIRTNIFLNFLWRSADKFATGFEIIRALTWRDLVTWEQTKMMAMFLRCLRYVFGAQILSRESALWWGQRERTAGGSGRARGWCGLGFQNTMGMSGYYWLEPRIDWIRLQFHSAITDQVLFGDHELQRAYVRRGGEARAFFDTTRRLELALEWLGICHIRLDQVRLRPEGLRRTSISYIFLLEPQEQGGRNGRRD